MTIHSLLVPLAVALGVEAVFAPAASAAESRPKPVLLYSRYYNAEGESRYLPEGTYKQVIQGLRQDFDVRVDNKPLTRESLAEVKLLLIANPSDKAVGAHPPPPHVSTSDIQVLTDFVHQGGIRASGQRRLLGLAHLGRRHHLHGLGDLGRVLDRLDAPAYVASAGHGRKSLKSRVQSPKSRTREETGCQIADHL